MLKAPDTHVRRTTQSVPGEGKADTSLQEMLKTVADVDAIVAIAKEQVLRFLLTT